MDWSDPTRPRRKPGAKPDPADYLVRELLDDEDDQHLAYEQLAAYVDRTLPAHERTTVEEHAAACSSRAADLASLANVAAALPRDWSVTGAVAGSSETGDLHRRLPPWRRLVSWLQNVVPPGRPVLRWQHAFPALAVPGVVVLALWLNTAVNSPSPVSTVPDSVKSDPPVASPPAAVVVATPGRQVFSPRSATRDALADQLALVDSTYQRGELARALVQMDAIKSPTDNRVRQRALALAEAAVRSMNEASTSARNQKAPDLAPGSFAKAEEARRTADVARVRSDQVAAAKEALAAAALYKRAEAEAEAIVAAARLSRLDTVPARGTDTVASTSRRGPADIEGIVQALERYRAAYARRDANALRAVYPSLPSDTAEQLRKSAPNVACMRSPSVSEGWLLMI